MVYQVRSLLVQLGKWRRRCAEARLAPHEALRRLGAEPYQFWCREVGQFHGMVVLVSVTMITVPLAFLTAPWILCVILATGAGLTRWEITDPIHALRGSRYRQQEEAHWDGRRREIDKAEMAEIAAAFNRDMAKLDADSRRVFGIAALRTPSDLLNTLLNTKRRK